VIVQRSDGMIRVRLEVDHILVPLEEHIASLRKVAAGLVDARVDTEERYGSCCIGVEGWRMPTLDELKELATQKDSARRHAREQLRRLRHDFSDLFDKQGRPTEESAPIEEDPDAIPF
jgi:hypothetical protein